MLINVVQTAERVYVIVKLVSTHSESADSKLDKKVTMITRLSRNQKQNKMSVFFLDVF